MRRPWYRLFAQDQDAQDTPKPVFGSAQGHDDGFEKGTFFMQAVRYVFPRLPMVAQLRQLGFGLALDLSQGVAQHFAHALQAPVFPLQAQQASELDFIAAMQGGTIGHQAPHCLNRFMITLHKQIGPHAQFAQAVEGG